MYVHTDTRLHASNIVQYLSEARERVREGKTSQRIEPKTRKTRMLQDAV